MKKLLCVFAVSISWQLAGTTLQAQPANDAFANAWTVTGRNLSTNGNSAQPSNATKEAGEPNHAGFTGGRSVWFNWTAPTNATIRIDTVGSAFNTLLGIYTGTAVNALTQIAANDNIGGGGAAGNASRVEFAATAGTLYRIAIDGRNNFGGGASSGAYVLTIQSLASVFITSPANGSVLPAGAPFAIDVDATVPNPPVTRLDFYRAGSLIGSDATAPYSITFSNAPLGTNSFTAVAVDNSSLSWTSAVVNVAVLNTGVTIVAPADGATFLNTSPIVVSAAALLPSGSMTNVEFFADGQKFGEDATSPFSATWATVGQGAHRLTAVGRDNAGNSYASAAVSIAVAQTLVQSNSVWKYLDTGTDLGTAWTAPAFNDGAWMSGPAELGYGDSTDNPSRPEATMVGFGPDPNNKFVTTYFRRSFVVTNVAGYTNLLINVRRDDGAVVHLNGVEAARYNMPAGPIAFTTFANNAGEDGIGMFPGTAPASLLVEGTNVLAVEIHQTTANSSDISFDLEMLGVPIIIRNQSPSISLTNPPNNAVFLAPASLTLDATASDADGSVAKVEFFDGSVKLGETTNSPYSFVWNNPPLGPHALRAVATDDQGASASSAGVAITIYDAAGSPFARITNPADGAVMEGPTNLLITAAASAILGVTNVEFYAGSVLIGTSAGTAPGLRADYQFQNSLDSSAGTAPTLVNLGANTFGRATVDGASRTVLRFAQNDGFSLSGASALIPGNVYSAVVLFSFNDVTSWRRIIDYKNASTDDGLYVYDSGLNLYPAVFGPANAIPSNTFVQVVLTRDSSSNVVGYVNGAQQFALVDSDDLAGVDASDLLRFFRDNGTEGSAGAVARLRLIDRALSPGEVAALDRLPSAGPASNFSIAWDAAFGTHALTAVAIDATGARGTSAVNLVTITIPPTNTVPPMIAAQSPAASATITNLTSIQVTFSERVSGVNAGDLRVNGVPAFSVTGNGSNYTFAVLQPDFGAVNITWTAGHGIQDFGYPSNLPFDENGPGATWSYTMVDRTPPVIAARTPLAGATVTNLTQVSVTFSEPVNGVDAADFLVNGAPAFGLSGGGSDYTFTFSQPGSGAVNVSWLAGHGIVDLSSPANAFNATGGGATWSYTLDDRTILVQSNANWLFIKGTTEASAPIDAWRQVGFDDSSWSNAPAPFYYGDPYNTAANPGTLLSDMQGGGYSSVYLRRKFFVGNASAVTNLFLNSQSDDGFIAWINGVEVLRYNMGAGDIPYNGSAPVSANEPNNSGAPYILNPLPDPGAYLVEGTNVLVIHAFNNSPATSSDFGINAQLYTYLADPSVVPPRITSVSPAAGDVFFLTNIAVRFTEPVSGVDAADLLVNGVAALGVSSSTNTTYTFTFVQPAFGPVAITWAAGAGIMDFDAPPKAFDGAAPGSAFGYSLINPSAPTVASQTPLAGATINNLSQLTVSFSEPVTGVNAGDLLVNFVPAASVSGGPTTYTFTFPQPNYGAVLIEWNGNPGITDLELAANPFDPTRFGASWSYTLIDQVPPGISAQTPAAGTQVTNLTQIAVTFTEPVTGVNASDLLINGVPASTLQPLNASTYLFTFPQPNATLVNVTWVPNHGIRDLAVTPNAFDGAAPGSTWSYSTPDNVAPSLAVIDPPAFVTVRSLSQVRVTFTEPVAGVDTNDCLINDRRPTQVSGSGAGPYTFNFAPPSNGVVEVRWAAAHGITDLASPPNPFAGGEWTYTLDPNAAFAGNVVINEIMFNPPGGRAVDEWIELHNLTAGLINVAGWRFDKGVDFTFPNVAIPARGYLVVAANLAAFQAKYPGVTNVIGGWTGSLANTDENVELVTALGESVNEVHYATEGDWARRERGNGAQRITSITRNGGTATVTIFGHGYTANDQVVITGADQPEYNGRFVATGIGVSSFNITVTGTPASPATGNIVSRLVLDNNASGWSWFSAADGLGSSLELVNAAVANTSGQNWAGSANVNGTPGVANSVAGTNAAPFLLDVTHFPAVPKSTEPVAITARVQDESTNGVQSVSVFYRNHTATGPGAFTNAVMRDNGAQGDGVANDGLFGAILPAAANGAVIEFYVEAADTGGRIRTWPAPAWDTNNAVGQFANAYYQVDNEVITNTMPAIRLVMSGTERAVFPPNNRDSDAAMNTTMISTDGDGTKVRYGTSVRVRGAGSRTRNPPNNRVNIPNDNRWNGAKSINLNSQFVHAQLVGNQVAQKSGLAATDARVAQYRINGVNPAPINAPANGSGNGAGYGTFLMVEPVNGDLAADWFPEDGNGNVYRASTGNHNANLDYSADPNNYLTRGYYKTSNQTENDWADIQNMTFAFSQVAANADYVQAISTNVNVAAWMRYFAVGTLVSFTETALFNGRGDDYALYRGERDPRFVLIGHDFDTIFGQGDTLTGYPADTNSSIYIMINPPNGNANVPLLRRFMTNAAFAPVFFSELKRLADTTFNPTNLNPFIDQLLTGWGVGPSAQTIADMKSYAANRRSRVLAQIPLTLSVGSAFTAQNGYLSSPTPNATLFGNSHAIDTRKVLVNGVTAIWSPWEARWTNSVSLQPGINRVLVQSLNGNNVEFARATADIWYDDGSLQNVSGALAADATWSAAGGPYNVTANLSIPAGVTLTIQPGASVYLGAGVNITVATGGRILAAGTDTARIRFTRAPGAAANWGQIVINGGAGSPETRIAYAHIEFNGAAAIDVNGGDLFLDHCSFGNTAVRYLDLDGASFVVQDCYFPNATAQFEPIHGTQGIKTGGRGIIQRCFVGRPIGYNDSIDFTGGNRPGPIIQVLNCVFPGSDDDILDFDSTDAWVEGNIFLHVHRNGSPDSASAISGGADNADTSQITAVGNLFYDVDQAANAKQGNFYTFINNTIVRQSRVGSQDVESGVITMADDGTVLGLGFYLEGNIIYDAEHLVRTQGVAQVTFTNNLINQLTGPPWTGAGGNNVNGDPLFVRVPQFAETTNFTTLEATQVMWEWFSLRPGSPAAGIGPNGRDLGAVAPPSPLGGERAGVRGVSLSGEPVGITPLNTATLRVGFNRTGSGIPVAGFPNGSGFTHYRWRLDGGVWSTETPIATPIALSGLSTGPHYVEVSGKNDAGFYQDDPIFGADAAVTISRTWTVNPNASSLRLNEILADNNSALIHVTTTPDAIELYNSGVIALDLGGVRLTDDSSDPDKFIFPQGTSLAAGAYLTVFANNPDGTPGFHLGFGLGQDGDVVYLYDSPGNGGALLDSVSFGPQLTDLSIGRFADGSWALTQPTFGAANKAAATGDPTRLRINEWLAIAQTPFNSDFVELYNGDPLPVSLGGLFLSDEILGWPDRHQIAALSFIRGFGYLRFFADGDPGQGAEHLNFRLSGDLGSIGLYLPDLTPIDCVNYQPQLPNRSQGRSPNGSAVIAYFDTPTPGAPNPLITTTPGGGALVINEVLASNASLAEPDPAGGSRTPDWIELYNGTTNLVNLADFSLTDDTLDPRRFVFAAGTTLAPGAYLRVLFDDGRPASATNTGFGLSVTGDGVYLFDALANGGSFLNSIVYGLQIPDLSIGQVPGGSGNWVLNSPTPGAANVAVPTLGDVNNLKVNEWMADAGPGNDDWFEIYNPNTQPVALGGLFLTDDLNSRLKHRITALSFMGAGTNAWQQFRADGNIGAGADHVSFSLRAAGEAVGISSTSGILINGYNFLGQQEGVSEGRFPDGGTNVVKFPGTDSPGASNYRRLAEVVINEALTHTDDPLEDAIELHNVTAQPIDIGGWWLSDDNGEVRKYQIPFGTTLPANGFAVIFETHFTNRSEAAIPFALSSKGDEVVLSSATNGTLTGYRAGVDFGAANNGVSFGRYITSDGREQFVAMSARTFGFDDPGNVTEFRMSTGKTNAYPHVGPVIVSEIMYHPPDMGTNDNVLEEFIELQNISTAPVALYDTAAPTNTWRLRDAVDFDFAIGTTLAAGEYLLVVSFDPVGNPAALASFRSRYNIAASTAIVGPYSGKLSNGDNSVELRKPDAPDLDDVPYVLVERVHYYDTAPWPGLADGTGFSLQRLSSTGFGNDPTNWFAAAPTPGPQASSGDTDGDGMPDSWENTYSFDRLNPADAALDSDGDGLTNLQEFQSGTNPRSSSSALRFLSASSGASGANAALTFSAAANKDYSVLWRESLSAGKWAKLADVATQPIDRIETVLDPLPPAEGRVYWVVTPQQPGPVNPTPAILTSPKSAVADVGGEASFHVSAASGTPLSYQWLSNGVAIPAHSGPSMTMTNVQFSDIALYSVAVSDAGNTETTAPVYLAVRPQITTQPAGQLVVPGDPVMFSVVAQGVGPLTYRWRKNDRATSGQTNSTLILPNVQAPDAGQYSVTVTHELPWGRFATTSSNAVLTVIIGLP